MIRPRLRRTLGPRLSILAVLAACAGRPEPPPTQDTTSAVSRPADRLVLSAPGGVEVWFTDSRNAEDSAGNPCVERVMQIRRSGGTIAVPLLYTGSVPRLVNDSTMEAPIWLHCRPGNVYQVDLRTGRPTRVK